ncbi:hypothetical protein [Bacillus massiliglaciei]|uniref:hypothetical protein n=1 Tax=Bacillus massiliglaciei TaxID=1816693 RepID=UPI000DA62898|nr:hypothetical protein [Bacillus massiliglaciei]
MFDDAVGKSVQVKTIGGLQEEGVLAAWGDDLLIIRQNELDHYIPVRQVVQLILGDGGKFVPEAERETSFRKLLMASKGKDIEILLEKDRPLKGYITSVMTNYFVLHSIDYKTVFVPMVHVQRIRFSVGNDCRRMTPWFPSSNGISLSRTWEDQLKKMRGRKVALDLGADPLKRGRLKEAGQSMAVLLCDNGEEVSWNTRYITCFHFI